MPSKRRARKGKPITLRYATPTQAQLEGTKPTLSDVSRDLLPALFSMRLEVIALHFLQTKKDIPDAQRDPAEYHPSRCRRNINAEAPPDR